MLDKGWLATGQRETGGVPSAPPNSTAIPVP
jgi:hypothetical protein